MMRAGSAAFVMAAMAARAAWAEVPKDPWAARHLIASGRLASVYVEPVLYHRADVPAGTGFAVAVWIRNTSGKTLGIDGTGETWFVHPNQWGLHDKPVREVVDERTMHVEVVDEVEDLKLVRELAAHQLPTIGPGSSFETFALFEGTDIPPTGTPADGAKFAIITFDGWVNVTDGEKGETLSAKARGSTESDMALPLPIVWKPAPPTVAKSAPTPPAK